MHKIQTLKAQQIKEATLWDPIVKAQIPKILPNKAHKLLQLLS